MKILNRNFRCRTGEIDLIGTDGDTLVFFEVKYRKDRKSGGAVYAVDQRKQIQICKVAQYYLYKKYYSVNIRCRFDVIAFDGEECNWIRNAFPYRKVHR